MWYVTCDLGELAQVTELWTLAAVLLIVGMMCAVLLLCVESGYLLIQGPVVVVLVLLLRLAVAGFLFSLVPLAHAAGFAAALLGGRSCRSEVKGAKARI